MTLINLLVAPIRRVVNFPLFQLMTAIAVILLLQAADSRSVFGEIFSALDLVVDFTVRLCASIFEVKSFTKSWLTTGFMIVYVYIAGLLIVILVKGVIRAAVELVARSNVFRSQECHRARAGNCSIPRMATAGENQARAYCAGEMGREVRLARRRQAPVPASYASGGARRSHLLGRDADYRRPAAGVHAFPRTDLAGQDGKSVGGGG